MIDTFGIVRNEDGTYGISLTKAQIQFGMPRLHRVTIVEDGIPSFAQAEQAWRARFSEQPPSRQLI